MQSNKNRCQNGHVRFQKGPTLKTFRCRAYDGPTMNAGLEACDSPGDPDQYC